jgi:hypothetical protein
MLRPAWVASAVLLASVTLGAADQRGGDSFLQRMARSYAQAQDTPGLLPRDSHSTVIFPLQ